jgi:ribosome maturation factor RimP
MDTEGRERIAMGDTAASLIRDLVDDHARGLDLDVLAVEHKGEGSRQLVRIVVDRKGGVSLGTCHELSQAVSQRLDEVDPIGGRYTLEVTSPGVDWPLTDQTAFDRVEGRSVLIHRRVGGGRVEQVRGEVVTAGTEAVQVADGDTTVAVAYDDIVKAAQALPW